MPISNRHDGRPGLVGAQLCVPRLTVSATDLVAVLALADEMDACNPGVPRGVTDAYAGLCQYRQAEAGAQPARRWGQKQPNNTTEGGSSEWMRWGVEAGTEA